jgi:predicted ATPase/DNA-binding SARP family transcriptional activator
LQFVFNIVRIEYLPIRLAMLRIHLLGSLRLFNDDVPLALATPPKTLHLLAYLLLHRQAAITRDHLAFTLWPDRSEIEARGQLRRYLYRLRQLLPEGEWLIAYGEQVQWNPAAADWLDVAEFERLSGSSEPDWLEAALKLYPQDLLIDLYDDWVIIERERLYNLYLADLQRLLEYYRGERIYDRAIACAQQILKREPLHENIVRELMRLHAAAGNRTQALEDYRHFQQRVVEELGVPPLPETTALYESLRQATFTPEISASHLTTRLVSSRPVKAPVPLTRTLGREPEVGTVRDLIQGSTARLLTLTGPGGTGKTRLAQEVAQRLVQDPQVFGDGIFYVSLSALTSPAFVLPAIARVLEVPETSQRSWQDAVKDLLLNKDLLLILDNFEHVVEAAPLVADLLSVSADLRVLITSREVLHVYGEYEFAVPPLPLPDLDRLPPPPDLLNFAAIALFAERARAARSDFGLTADNAAAVAEICVRLDGLPLAIELAAARSKLFTPEAMLPRLSDRLNLLNGPIRDQPDRQRTLRGAIDWSYNLLSGDEKILFTRLSVFAGSFTAEAVQALELIPTDRTEASPLEVLDRLAALIDKSMLRTVTLDAADSAPRFRMLSTLREYAQEKLLSRGEAADLQLRHAHYHFIRAREGAPALRGPQQLEWMRRLEAERDNFRAALSWTLELAPEHADEGLRLAVALGRFWSLQGDWTEGAQWLLRALAQQPQARPATRAWGLSMASELLDKLGRISEADALAAESLALFRELGEARGLADALCNLAGARLSQNDYDRAVPLLLESLALYRQLDVPTGAALALSYLGMLAKEQGDYDRAVACHEECLELNRRAGNAYGVAHDLTQLSFDVYWLGQYERSAELAQQAVELARRMNNRRGLASALDGVGAALGKLGQYTEAQHWLSEALTLYRESGNKSGQAMVLTDLAMIAAGQHNYLSAQELYIEALGLAWQIGDRRRMAFCLEGLGQVNVESDPERTASWLSAADRLREIIAAPLPPAEQALYDHVLAQLHARLSPEIFEAAWQFGRTTPLPEIVTPLLG